MADNEVIENNENIMNEEIQQPNSPSEEPNVQYIRIGQRVFEDEKKLEDFLKIYGSGAEFQPYSGEVIIVKGATDSSYRIGDGETPYDNLISSKSLYKTSYEAEKGAPDYIHGIETVKNTLANLTKQVEQLSKTVAWLKENLEALNGDAVLKSNIPKGLVLSFANNNTEEPITTDSLKEAFGGTNWNRVEGYLKGVSDEEGIGYYQGDTTVEISDIPKHSHTFNGSQTSAVGLDAPVTVEYTPSTVTVKAFNLGEQLDDITPSIPGEGEDEEEEDDVTTPTEDMLEAELVYQAKTGTDNILGKITGYNKNDWVNGYAGTPKVAMTGIRVFSPNLELKYKVRKLNSKAWEEEQIITPKNLDGSKEKIEDVNFSPATANKIDGFMITTTNPNYKITYRAHVTTSSKSEWLNIISDYNTANDQTGYAGYPGYTIDAIMIKAEVVGG